jgi:hypothetical protein
MKKERNDLYWWSKLKSNIFEIVKSMKMSIYQIESDKKTLTSISYSRQLIIEKS